MYDELVKRLRDWPRVCVQYDGSVDQLHDEAANAIEELTAYVRQIEKLRKKGYYLQKTKMMTYGQATMTMPIPELPQEEGD